MNTARKYPTPLPLFTFETVGAFPFPTTFRCCLWPSLRQNTPPKNQTSRFIAHNPFHSTLNYGKTQNTVSTPKPPRRDASLTGLTAAPHQRVSKSLPFCQLHHQLPLGNCCLPLVFPPSFPKPSPRTRGEGSRPIRAAPGAPDRCESGRTKPNRRVSPSLLDGTPKEGRALHIDLSRTPNP